MKTVESNRRAGLTPNWFWGMAVTILYCSILCCLVENSVYGQTGQNTLQSALLTHGSPTSETYPPATVVPGTIAESPNLLELADDNVINLSGKEQNAPLSKQEGIQPVGDLDSGINSEFQTVPDYPNIPTGIGQGQPGANQVRVAQALQQASPSTNAAVPAAVDNQPMENTAQKEEPQNVPASVPLTENIAQPAGNRVPPQGNNQPTTNQLGASSPSKASNAAASVPSQTTDKPLPLALPKQDATNANRTLGGSSTGFGRHILVSILILAGLFVVLIGFNKFLFKKQNTINDSSMTVLGTGTLLGKTIYYVELCNKILIVTLNANSLETLTEINDSGEMKRIKALALAHSDGKSTSQSGKSEKTARTPAPQSKGASK